VPHFDELHFFERSEKIEIRLFGKSGSNFVVVVFDDDLQGLFLCFGEFHDLFPLFRLSFRCLAYHYTQNKKKKDRFF